MVRTEQEMGRVMGTRKKGGGGGGQEQNNRETSGGEHWRDRVRIYGSKHNRREELFPVNNTINKFTVGLSFY